MLTQGDLARRLVEARERAGLTQEQVAAALKVPRTAVTQIEAGNRQVSSLELVRLGQLYGVELRDLIEGRDSGHEIMALFRSTQQTSLVEEERAIRDVLPICRIASDVEDLLEAHDPSTRALIVPQYSSRIAAGSATVQGREIARLERERLGLGFAPIGDMMLLVFKHGMIVAEHALPEGVSGIFLHGVGRRQFILLHEEESHGRRRFSLAHEFCHSLVDGHERLIVSREKDESTREWRANSFASAFLMPKEAILQFLVEKQVVHSEINFTHAAELSAKFGISYEATLISLENYGFVSASVRADLQGRSKQAKGFLRTKLGYREPRYGRTSLREWTFFRMLRALELGIISRRKALSLAMQLGYDQQVVVDNMALLGEDPEA